MQPFSIPGQSASIVLGFILIFAFLFGKQVNRLNLPRITGFICAGILCGPYIFKFLSATDVRDLQLLDGLALSLIALTAGGEMHMERLVGRMRTISLIVLFQTFIIIAGFLALGFAGRQYWSFLPNDSTMTLIAFFLLLGTLAAATSPSTTIAVITETASKGKYTDLVLSSAIFKDFFVIGLFALTLSASKSMLSPDKQFDAAFLLHVLRDIGGSILIGALVGGAIILYIKLIKRELTVFILAIAFFTYQISHGYGFHPLMICLVAGFVVQNLTTWGEDLIVALEKISMPVYVIFFAISGASLDLNALRTGWLIALIFVAWRGFLTFGGTYVGSRLAGEDRGVRRHVWTGFIAQAGVALGMAIIIEDTFPEWGGGFKALILAVIAINQVIGPVFLQKLLIRKGEAGKNVI
jgi:Kef-type K+ transport system membrane component KefB